MSPSEYVEWLMKIGTGWLGYRPDDVMDMDISDLVLAYDGKIDYLEFTGVIKRKEQPGMGPVDSPEDFDARTRFLN